MCQQAQRVEERDHGGDRHQAGAGRLSLVGQDGSARRAGGEVPARELDLRAERGREEQQVVDVTVLATTLAMNYLQRGQFTER